MDPSVFFGRSRVTRQTLKPKQQTPDCPNVDNEVNVKEGKRTRNALAASSNSKKRAAVVGKENGPALRSKVKGTKKDEKKECKKTTCKSSAHSLKEHVPGDEEDCSQEQSSKSSAKCQEVHLAEGGNCLKEPVPTGPVYRNVRQSDVGGDSSDVYEFPVDENSVTSKKKPSKIIKSKATKAKATKTKATKAKVSKAQNWYGIVKWDPTKKPVLGKFIKSNPTKKKAPINIPLVNKTTNDKVVPPVKPQDGNKMEPIAQQSHVTKPKVHLGETLQFEIGNHFTSTPVVKSSQASKVLAPARSPSGTSTKLPSNIACSEKTKPATNANKVVLKPTVTPTAKSVSPCASAVSSTTIVGISNVSSVQQKSAISPVSTSAALSTPVRVPVAIASTSSNHIKRTFVGTPSVCVPMPSLCVRESPSFVEPETTAEVPVHTSPVLPESPIDNPSCTITSTPVARSKNGQALKTPSVRFAALQSSLGQVTYSPVPETSGTSVNTEGNDYANGDLSGLFDDFPRTSVLPTRMFSTHRGTVFIPDAERSKRKLPTLSPNTDQCSVRAAAVKFAVPQTSTGVDNCFGFNEDDPVVLPQQITGNRHVTATRAQVLKKQRIEKPSVQEVQAILRGQQKLASPANIIPRSIQTKLTDFVSSTPSSTPSRSTVLSKSVLITPTPVPLFGEEDLDTGLQSPFIQPSRRSYDRLRPIKRIACGDEVHSDHEEDDETTGAKPAEYKAPKTIKKNRSYKKKKKPRDVQLDSWASQLTSHFEEVEEVELQVE